MQSETKPGFAQGAPPRYVLTLAYTRSTGKGKNKTFISKGNSIVERPYIDFFDVDGSLDEGSLAKWLGESSASLVNDKSTPALTNS